MIACERWLQREVRIVNNNFFVVISVKLLYIKTGKVYYRRGE